MSQTVELMPLSEAAAPTLPVSTASVDPKPPSDVITPVGNNLVIDSSHAENLENGVVVTARPSPPVDTLEAPPAEAAAVVAEDESAYPTGLQFYLIMFSAGLLLVMVGLDNSIISVILPALTDEFRTTADVGWYTTSFRLCYSSFQFVAGKAYRVYPLKRVFMASVLLFALGSVVCATARTSAGFVTGRAVTGLASGFLITGCFALLVQTMPLRKRPLAAGILGPVEDTAGIAAPIVGGALVDGLGWRWCFWISLPLGGVVLAGLWLCLPDRPPFERQLLSPRARLAHLDLVGNVLLVPSLVCLFMALGWAGTRYPWRSPTIIGLVVAFAALLVLFVLHQARRGEQATLPLRIVGRRSVWFGFLFSLGCNAAINVVQYYLPTYYQAVRRVSAAESGYLLFPMMGGSILATLAQGSAVSLFGYYTPFMLATSVLLPVFSGLMTTLTRDTALVRVLLYSGFFGFAGNIGFQGPQSAVQTCLPAADASTGLAIIVFAQSFGAAVALGAAESIFSNQVKTNMHTYAPSVNETLLETSGFTDAVNVVQPDEVQGVLLALDKSLAHTWYLSVGLACFTMVGSLGTEWKSVKEKRE